MSKHTIEVPLSEVIDTSTIEDLKVLKKDLGAMGVRLTIPDALPGGTLVFEYDDEAHKRNAGRKKKAIPADSGLSEMTQAQMDEWLLDAPIAEIASQVGYGTQGKFSEAFKDVAQMLPTAYRKARVSSDRASEARP